MAPQEAADGTVIVVGAGLSGIATALGAALLGRPVTVFEAADLVGGAAAYSGGQVWVGANHVAAREGIDDDLERTERYVRGIAGAHPELLDEHAMRRWLTTAPVAVRYWEDVGAVRWTVIRGLADYHTEADGALASGRYLTGEPIDGASLGRVAGPPARQPVLPRRDDLCRHVLKGRRRTRAGGAPSRVPVRLPRHGDGRADTLTFGTGVVAGFLARVAPGGRASRSCCRHR